MGVTTGTRTGAVTGGQALFTAIAVADFEKSETVPSGNFFVCFSLRRVELIASELDFEDCFDVLLHRYQSLPVDFATRPHRREFRASNVQDDAIGYAQQSFLRPAFQIAFEQSLAHHTPSGKRLGRFGCSMLISGLGGFVFMLNPTSAL